MKVKTYEDRWSRGPDNEALLERAQRRLMDAVWCYGVNKWRLGVGHGVWDAKTATWLGMTNNGQYGDAASEEWAAVCRELKEVEKFAKLVAIGDLES